MPSSATSSIEASLISCSRTAASSSSRRTSLLTAITCFATDRSMSRAEFSRFSPAGRGGSGLTSTPDEARTPSTLLGGEEGLLDEVSFSFFRRNVSRSAPRDEPRNESFEIRARVRAGARARARLRARDRARTGFRARAGAGVHLVDSSAVLEPSWLTMNHQMHAIQCHEMISAQKSCRRLRGGYAAVTRRPSHGALFRGLVHLNHQDRGGVEPSEHPLHPPRGAQPSQQLREGEEPEELGQPQDQMLPRVCRVRPAVEGREREGGEKVDGEPDTCQAQR